MKPKVSHACQLLQLALWQASVGAAAGEIGVASQEQRLQQLRGWEWSQYCSLLQMYFEQ